MQATPAGPVLLQTKWASHAAQAPSPFLSKLTIASLLQRDVGGCIEKELVKQEEEHYNKMEEEYDEDYEDYDDDDEEEEDELRKDLN